jgi:arsenate reductase
MALTDTSTECVLIHNPRCSKSRRVNELLEERGVAFRERRYLEQPLSRAELEDLRGRLGEPAGAWVRRGEAAYREHGLGPESDDAAYFDAMKADPILVERPILVVGPRALVGRPPERALDLLSPPK